MADELSPRAAGASPPVRATTDWPPARIIAAIGGAAIVAGSFGPWLTATIGPGGSIVSETGMDSTAGEVAAVLGTAIVVLVFAKHWEWAIVAALVALGLAIVNYVDTQGRITAIQETAANGTLEWGIYAMALGALASIIATVKHHHRLSAPLEPTSE